MSRTIWEPTLSFRWFVEQIGMSPILQQKHVDFTSKNNVYWRNVPTEYAPSAEPESEDRR